MALFCVVFFVLPGVTCFVVLPQEDMRPTTELVQSLLDTHATLDAKMAASKVSLFSGSATLDSVELEEQGR